MVSDMWIVCTKMSIISKQLSCYEFNCTDSSQLRQIVHFLRSFVAWHRSKSKTTKSDDTSNKEGRFCKYVASSRENTSHITGNIFKQVFAFLEIGSSHLEPILRFLITLIAPSINIPDIMQMQQMQQNTEKHWHENVNNHCVKKCPYWESSWSVFSENVGKCGSE